MEFTVHWGSVASKWLIRLSEEVHPSRMPIAPSMKVFAFRLATPSACPIWVTLKESKTPIGIALGVIAALKTDHHVKVATTVLSGSGLGAHSPPKSRFPAGCPKDQSSALCSSSSLSANFRDRSKPKEPSSRMTSKRGRPTLLASRRISTLVLPGSHHTESLSTSRKPSTSPSAATPSTPSPSLQKTANVQ